MTFTPIGETGRTLAEKNQSAGGGKLGETGSGTSLQNSSEIAAWLAKQTPGNMDKAAVLRAQSHGADLMIRYEGRYPSGPNGERLPSYQVAVGCEVNGSQAARDAALADLRNFMAPAPIRQIENWLAELSVLTAGRGKDGFEAELALTAYSSRLAQYPADVARYALLGKSWKWFPTWAELEAVCNTKTGPRRHMISALARPEPDLAPTRRPPTEDERERIAALIAEKFPNVPQGWRDRALAEAMEGDCMTDGGTVKRMETDT